MKETADRLEIANHYERVYNITLNYKLVEKMDPVSLEYSFRMCRLDQKMHEAATSIVSCWRGYKARRMIVGLLRARKTALLLIQFMVKRKIKKRRIAE